MPASRRHHRTLTIMVNCLGVLAVLPVPPSATAPRAAAPAELAAAPVRPAVAPARRPTPIPTGVPAAPPAVAATKAAPIQMSTPPVTVAVAAAGTPAPGYRIQVRNAGNTPVETTVRQELPTGSRSTTVTGGGRATRPVGSTGTNEVTWRLRLPARSSTTLNTAFTLAAPGRSVTAPTCAYGTDGTRPYDCATATWTPPTVPAAAKVTTAPAWLRPAALLGALAALLVVAGGALSWRSQHRRRRRYGVAPAADRPRVDGGPGVGTAARMGGAEGGTLYPRPAMPTPASRRRTPPLWLVAGAATAVLAGVVGAAGWTATRRVATIDTARQPTSGAWMGRSVTGAIGVPLREAAFEFTVYRMACGTGGPPTAKPGGRQCLATVGVRNLTTGEQTWHGQLQRAYLPGGNWVATDEDATRVANLGRDVFAQPVAAGSRVLLPLVFTVDGDTPPKQLELRSGVFSAGVRVDVR